VQQPQMIIEIRPFRGDWQCYEETDVQPYYPQGYTVRSVYEVPFFQGRG